MTSISPASLLPRTTELVREYAGMRILQLTETRWRITQPNGAVVAYLDCADDSCWTLSRMSSNRRTFAQLGMYDSMDAALAGLRYL